MKFKKPRIYDIERRLKSLEKKEVAGACVDCDGRGNSLEGYSKCFSCRRKRGWGLPTKELRNLRKTLESILIWLRHQQEHIKQVRNAEIWLRRRQEHIKQVRKAESNLAKLIRRLEKQTRSS